MERTRLEHRFQDLTHVVLPSLGRTRGWPIAEDHAFVRVVLDHLFADSCNNHLGRSLRAYKHLNDTQLAQAVAIADRLTRADADTIRLMDEQSRKWRDQPLPGTVRHHPPLASVLRH